MGIGDRVRVTNPSDPRVGQIGLVVDIERGELTGAMMYFVEFAGGVCAWFFAGELKGE